MRLPALLAFVTVTAAAAFTHAGTVVSHSGYLLDAADQPVSGTLGMRFRLYDAASGGALLWTGDAAGTPCNVAVARGYYAVVLGQECGSAIAEDLLPAGATRWLEVVIGGVALSPRQHLVPVSATDSTRLGGEPASAFVRHADLGQTGTASIHATRLDAGVLADARLPSSVPLLNRTAQQNFTGDIGANAFWGSGAHLANVDAATLQGNTVADIVALAGGGGGTTGGSTMSVLTLTANTTTGGCTAGQVRWTGTTFEGCTTLGWANLLGMNPTVTAVTPAAGVVNTTRVVVLSGQNFSAPATVRVGGVAATGVTVDSATSLTATFPGLPAGTYDVTVTNGDNRPYTLVGGYRSMTQPLPDTTGLTVLWVSTTGNDTTGNGTQGAPYASLKQAVTAAGATGYAIHLLPGTYRAAPMNLPSGYATAGIHDLGKRLLIFGEGSNTIVEVYGADSTTTRDAHALSLAHANSLVTLLKVNFYPNRNTSYSDAIFGWSTGTVTNVYFENKSATVSWSYCYDNNSSAFSVKNSTFKTNGRSTSDYSGNPTFRSCHFQAAPTIGSVSYSVTRAVNAADLLFGSLPSDLRSLGDPAVTNAVDGSRANIGVGGGLYDWTN